MFNGLAIDVVGAWKSYREVPVLRGLDLHLPRGASLSLIGLSGAGKTTLIRVLGTLIRPDRGQVRIGGYDLPAQCREVRRQIALSEQHPVADRFQTGRENLAMVGRLLRLSRSEARLRADEMLELTDLADVADERVRHYTDGQTRRLDLAVSSMRRPPVLLLDEPTTGLEPSDRHAVCALVARMSERGTTVLMTTRFPDEAEELDVVGVLDGGRVHTEHAWTDLRHRLRGRRLVLTVTDGLAFDHLRTCLGPELLKADVSERTLVVASDGSATQVRGFLDRIDPMHNLVREFAITVPTAEDMLATLKVSSHPGAEREEPWP